MTDGVPGRVAAQGGRDAEVEASPEQKALRLVEELHPGTAAYNVPVAFRVYGPLDVAALQRAFVELVARHDALRTRLHRRDGTTWQRIVAMSETETPSLVPEEVPDEQAWENVVREEAQRPIDVLGGPPLRARLLRLGPEDHVLVAVLHHATVDGWSLRLLLDELSTLYQSCTEESPSATPRSRGARKGGEARDGEALAHWRQRLADAPASSGLRPDHLRPPVQDLTGTMCTRTMSGDLGRAVRSTSREWAVTPFVTLLAAFSALLHRASGDVDLLVGSPYAGRDELCDPDVIGCFVNTLVYRVDLTEDPTFRELTARVQRAVFDTIDDPVPFDRLVGDVVGHRDPSLPPLVQTTFGIDDRSAGLDLPGLTTSEVFVHNGCSKFDVSWVVVHSGEQLAVRVEYATRLFAAETVQRLLDQYEILLAAALGAPHVRISELPLIRNAERDRLLRLGRGPCLAPAVECCADEAFARRAESNPHAVAVVHGTSQLTYGELHRRSDHLAHVLRELGVMAESLVGLLLGKSVDSVVAVLAIWKAGGAYLPLDSDHPADRIRHVLSDAHPTVLISDRDGVAADTVPVFRIDRWHPPAGEAPGRPGGRRSPRGLAYGIYTSGSTGAPKCTLVEHAGVVNLAAAQQLLLGDLGAARVFQYARATFDASVWELVMALLGGGTLCLPTDLGPLTGRVLAEQVRGNGTTHLTLSPSVLSSVPDGDELGVEVLVSAGEELPKDVADRWASGCRLINAYGPTETTVAATAGHHAPQQGRPAIGGPIGNAEAYVLDEAMNVVPVGIPGQLHVGGAVLTRGYLGRPGLTAEKFVPHPFAERPGSRLYRTGDVVRWRSDGRLEFLGRADRQVKIRGIRVELGEVEEALRSHPQVGNAAVVVSRDALTERRLVGYVAVGETASLTVDRLRDHLRGVLPAALVPAAIVVVAELPVTAHGKIDFAALPVPADHRPRMGHDYVAALDGAETELAEAWAQIIGVDRVGATDDFFALGGTSADLVRVRDWIEHRWNTRVPTAELFGAHNVRLLAEYLSRETAEQSLQDGSPESVRDRRRAAVAARRVRKGRTPDGC